MKMTDALPTPLALGCPIKPTLLRGFSGCRRARSQTRIRVMAAVHTFERCPTAGDTLVQTPPRASTVPNGLAHPGARQRLHVWTDGHPLLCNTTPCVNSPGISTRRLRSLNDAEKLEGVSCETCSHNLSLVEKSSVSQDAASANEIAPGVAFGSLFPGVVTRVT